MLIVTIMLNIIPKVDNQVHAAQLFSDLPETHWATESVSTLVSLDLINGYPDGTFRPDNPIKIEEFVKLTVSALGYTNLPSNGGHWSYPYFEKADELGLFKDPKNYVNVGNEYISRRSEYIRRKEVAFLLLQAEKIIQNGNINYEASQEFIKSQIEDLNDINPHYKDAVINAYGLGLINGFPDNTFRPDGNLTRAQAAIVIYRLLFEEQRVPLMPINKQYSTTSQIWEPLEYGDSTDDVVHWESVLYLTKLEAYAVHTGINDPEVIKELKAAKKFILDSGNAVVAGYTGIAMHSWAIQMGYKKLATWILSIPGGLTLGFIIGACLGIEEKVGERAQLENAIENTNEGYFVQIKKSYTTNITFNPITGVSYITTSYIKDYNAFNSNTLEGVYNIPGKFSPIDYTEISVW